MVNVVLAGGGTAGHTSPLIATAQALVRHPDLGHLSCIGTPKGLEGRVIPEAGLELDMIDPVPLPRKLSAELLEVPAHLRRAVHQAAEVLRTRQADVLVGFGGYVSMPGYLAARRAKVPIVIHEQNAVPGLANKVASRFAARVAVAFPGTPLPGARFIGMPLRDAVTGLARQDAAARRSSALAARAALGLDPDRPTLLVSGGSQGAVAINDAVVAARDRLLADGVQILHVLGPKNIGSAVTVTDPDTGARWVPVAYLDDMSQGYAAADLMVARAGAGTVVETAAVGLPTIYVPLPHGNGEQARNAVSVVEAGAGVLVDNAALDASRLLTETARIHQPQTLAAMSSAGQSLMPADAAEKLAEIVLGAADRSRTARPVPQEDPDDAA
ncbi:UDP-N-acetylglucosamine--N-acetylmuramyl-(pentapeptide) pyrophosphoryl-undecaprenol N-acetylglucosamine transferase [Acidipropionibacterium jensenii]|uniref:UDP-N-acetylglucosamine--N-acetylmuramyl-(pentapeptide) pyrophosphoryl-undecaprenol N-acetylglucosamine transferase n=1 Tax=Acidipropionibacterium jensenii TaxID=1749 RepID=A0A448NX55_9ACTN|nr:undecaprenyldiphospho-muramoylpentapeptide beta-N-acetylglucosaminyltransferase [Acidipropionibacterium jensenii]AZZ39780.1 undecaprenyldiphospho-muramoylpentapeptide beta-N-acetylglucosaminyltransferase [Acidipropionibacterium jensenii]MDN6791118.1 undecaprenyldiphospho-muramoylpentapeptide beta-N-acetylglucosaminyltransferase [Acidipropionibacterium jensenii]QCV86979.1 undecaprenyldiphospho-muramoylpentapeptide beta-N-acetylglucosaminyltransferase [Acidipropionibacterium jensenii]VEI02515.